MTRSNILYKRDSTGKVREWRMELLGDKYRTIAGVQGGQQVTSAWTIAKPKNVGRSNATTPEQQAFAEVKATYVKKLDVDYHEIIDTIDTPKIFQPMLAAQWDARKAKINYNNNIYFQGKLDGIRCIATRHGMWTRKGKPIVAAPHIMEALQPAFDENPDAIFDGELYNHVLRDDFNEITSIVKRQKVTEDDLEKSKQLMQFHIYDYPYLMGQPFSARFAAVVKILVDNMIATEGTGGNSPIQIVTTHLCKSEAEIDARYDEVIDQGYEGGIIRLDEKYTQKRSNALLKRKDFDDEEFIIVRIEEGSGNWAGCAKRLIFQNNMGECGETGAGMRGKRPYLRKVFENRDAYVGKEATIRYFGRTPGKLKPRIPVVTALHLEPRM